jgi:hypothetical protein
VSGPPEVSPESAEPSAEGFAELGAVGRFTGAEEASQRPSVAREAASAEELAAAPELSRDRLARSLHQLRSAIGQLGYLGAAQHALEVGGNVP